MSLFETLDFWSTRCGENENFGFECMVVSNLLEDGNECILVASHSGTLRIYHLNDDQIMVSKKEDQRQLFHYKATDLLLEMSISRCIIQVVVGRLISGSNSHHIGIVTPASLSVCTLSAKAGSSDVEHGRQFELITNYVHSLKRSVYRVIVGPFGRVDNRDFLCVIALDGTLIFFEQETFVAECRLAHLFFPCSICYVPFSDTFVALNADWNIEAYRYEDIINTSKIQKTYPVWSYILGENVIAMQTIDRFANDESVIVVLSERNFSCYGANGGLRFKKRLHYSPVCFLAFVDEHNERNITILVASDSGIMYIYRKTKLLWSSKLPVLPVCISRATTIVTRGTLVVLSEDGELKCCYLGTKPSSFETPSVRNSSVAYENANHKLNELYEEIEHFEAINSSFVGLAEQKVSVALKIHSSDTSQHRCRVEIELVPSCTLSNVLITFFVDSSFSVHPRYHVLAILHEKTVLTSHILLDHDKRVVPSFVKIMAVVCCGSGDSPNVIRHRRDIPAKFLLCANTVAQEKCPYKLSISLHAAPIPLTNLFQDLKDDCWLENACNNDAAGFCLRRDIEDKCWVSFSNTKRVYDLAANSMPMLRLILAEILTRYDKSKKIVDKLTTSFSFDLKLIPKDTLIDAIEDHIKLKNDRVELQTHCDKLAAQFRLIQKKILVKLKSKTISEMCAVQILYRRTYDELIETVRKAEEKHKDSIECCNKLQSVLGLICDLMATNNSIDVEKVSLFRKALSTANLEMDYQIWEDRTRFNLTYLMRTSFSVKVDRAAVPFVSDATASNTASIKYLILTAIEKLTENSTSAYDRASTSRIDEEEST